MANDRLAAALNNHVGGSDLRKIAYQRAMSQRGLYCDCGFCGYGRHDDNMHLPEPQFVASHPTGRALEQSNNEVGRT